MAKHDNDRNIQNDNKKQTETKKHAKTNDRNNDNTHVLLTEKYTNNTNDRTKQWLET